MKLIYSLFAIFFMISIHLIQINSFTKAEISNKAILSISSEENALIAISYRKNNVFAIKNNTGNPIEIESIVNLEHTSQKISNANEGFPNLIPPGKVKEFTIIGEQTELIGGILKINIRWDGGSAEIRSKIPDVS
ncbi:hypothetical protein [Neobacillus sp. SAB-20_R2A]|uniref:hypothetical protein n=1 Tax=Neobacillus sp. SAB-20_R2A TaxID=3120519 RepID=UPI003C6E88CB